ncbi:MAG: hypothetical protein BWK78_10070 [Thiotrichaceae bacterium IS1]|nr:MAG: hypothetical protein BWK78_10070 [Thiotrichaceae bacterium IS1]
MKCLFLILSCLISPLLQAETLLEVYKLAEEHDPQLKIANSNRLLVLEKNPQARAYLLPQVTVGASAAENSRAQNWMFGKRIENTSVGYNISLVYSLFHREREIALEQVDSQIKAVEASYLNTKQSVIEQISSRYFAVLSGNDNLKLARGAKEAFQRQLDQAKQRFNVGLIAITDVQEAQAAYDLAVADEISAQNQLDNTKEALRELTGIYHEALAALSEEAPLLGPEPAEIGAWTKAALTQNPQLLAARYEVETARQEIERQRATQLPTVDLVGRHSYDKVLRGDESPGNMETSNSVGVQLNYLLYEGGAIRSRIREAQQRYTQTLDQVEQMRRSVQRQTHAAFLNLWSSISRIKALKQALFSTKTALEAVKTGFEVGTRTTVDVLNAERDLLKAQRDYSTSRYDYVLATIRLKQAVGSLNEKDLEDLEDWLTSLTIEMEVDRVPPVDIPAQVPAESSMEIAPEPPKQLAKPSPAADPKISTPQRPRGFK